MFGEQQRENQQQQDWTLQNEVTGTDLSGLINSFVGDELEIDATVIGRGDNTAFEKVGTNDYAETDDMTQPPSAGVSDADFEVDPWCLYGRRRSLSQS